MGITIHWTFITRDPATVIRACWAVAEEAEKTGYRCEEFSSEGRALYMRSIIPLHDFKDFKGVLDYLRERYGGFRALDQPLKELPDEPPFAFVVLGYPDEDSFMYAIPWLSLPSYGCYNRTEGIPTEVHGVVVDPPQVDDRYTAESFNLLFYKVGRWFLCSGFCKTQPFTVDEVEHNIRYHKWICSVLRRVAGLSMFWYHRYVHDEGRYYETMDLSILEKSFEVSSTYIWAHGSILQDVADKLGSGLSVDVAGVYSVKKMKRRLRETRIDGEQSTLDEFGGA